MLRIYLLVFIVFQINACAHTSRMNSSRTESILGVYKVVDRVCPDSFGDACKATDNSIINACHSVKFLEFVKGRFFDIADDEMAFVDWRGEGDLLYSAKKYEGKDVLDSYPATLVIVEESDYNETVEFQSPGEGVFSYGKPLSACRSKLFFRPTTESDLRGYTKEYPGNE